KKSIAEVVAEKITTREISDEKFESLFEPMWVTLLENSVAFEVVEAIKEELKKSMKKVRRGKEKEEILLALRRAFESVLLDPPELEIKNKPTVIMFVGVNGAGKTTTLAKMAYYLKNKGYSCVIAASDTFRAASIEQLEKHAANLDVHVIKHTYGSDAAAVAFDAIKHAKAKGIDVVLIDTAGRSHSNVNLMDELKKIKRVTSPDYVIFVGDALTGNDAVNQAKSFNDAVGIDYVILSKSDVDQKGGAVLSIAYVTKKPILFLGTGQSYEDLVKFDKKEIIDKIIGE
ncbi:MAG TPA: signal recognition particle-docking protein FtsY, partial [Candidatus Aenigmarchaeota archaeon]|nr:signal recognition particle-docking protein FtsY [Candidatus Aenigmarchaeota archaeon]HEX32918.1 signal recognition particle-docking protein FtsY [Candidatus Aenigmarchaeota archaeon]